MPLFSHTHYWYKVSRVKYKILVLLLLYSFMDTFSPSDVCLYKYSQRYKIIRCCQNIISSVLLLYCRPVSPDLCLYNKCKEFSEHSTILSVVFQNIIITAVLEILEFRDSSKLFTEMMMEKENICIPDGIKNVGLSLRYIGIYSAGLSNVGLLNIDNTTSVNPKKDYLVFLLISAAWQTI